MKLPLLNKIKKDKLLKNELRRAHFMIALLAIGIALLTMICSTGYTDFSPVLTTSLIILSCAIALISLFVVIRLSRK